jgi:predicted alpha/beta superfamily hydrolase
MYSENVRDSFEIYINLPKSLKENDTCKVFYYLDANLKSGKKLRRFIKDSLINKESCRTIFVGIGHIGNYRVLRRRDFTVPKIKNLDTTGISENFGQIEPFYRFLVTELMPTINSSYTTSITDNSIFGHSFGGLFAVYCLFKNDIHFSKYYSLSPSLWINDYSIYDFNHLSETSNTNRSLFLSVGGMEIINRIKPGADEFEEYLNSKRYSHLVFDYKIYSGETHNSQVALSIEDIFKSY